MYVVRSHWQNRSEYRYQIVIEMFVESVANT